MGARRLLGLARADRLRSARDQGGAGHMSGSHETAHQHRPHTGARIHLAREPAIRLGALVIEPALRRVAHDDGREEIVEPRVMQVLVALVRAAGGIVTRDDLLATCWHGVVVGEDAINRVLSRLRRLADGIGEGQFKLETVTKVGYRLVLGDHARPVKIAEPTVVVAKPVATDTLLAVLAFDNLSADPELAYFCDGLSEEILQTVARGTELKVIGRSSSFQFRGAGKAAKNIAAELGATHALDGSVRRNGPRVRIAAHLIECAGGTALWSGTFDRDLTDIFALQDEIAGAVAAALEIAFAPAGPARPIDAVAHDLYLRARALAWEGNSIAEGLLEQVTNLEPGFAPAWAALAQKRAELGRFASPDGFTAATRAAVTSAAETALRLDPSSGLAYAALNLVVPFGHYAEREQSLRRGLALAPNDAIVLTMISTFCLEVGRAREAFGYALRAREVDPLLPWAVSAYGNCLCQLGLWDEGSRVLNLARTRWPEVPIFRSLILQFAAFRDQWIEFDVAAEQWPGEQPAPAVRDALFVGKVLRNPNAQTRTRMLDRLREELARTGALPLGLLLLADHMGLRDEVFELIETASFSGFFDVSASAPSGVYTTSIIFFLPPKIFLDLRFPRLCAKLGLCEYWVETDRWPDCADADALPYDFKAEVRRLAGA